MKFIIFAFLHSLFLFPWNVHAATTLCGQITVEDGKFKLDPNEKTMICGSDKHDNEAWRQIPLPEVEFHLRTLLGSRGYLDPRFERDKESLKVWLGPIRKITDLVVHGDEGLLHPSKKRKIRGAPLTPAKLDEVTQWADLKLRSEGYACEKADVQAQAWDGAVHVDVSLGEKKVIGTIRSEGAEGLDPAVLLRYQAFKAGQVYDVRKTQITTARMLGDGLFQSAYYTNSCRPGVVDLTLKASLGEPRLFRFGIGASTEEYVFTDISFRNVRLDKEASSFTARLHLSPILQKLEASSELYILPFTKRTYFGPRFQVSHDRESSYEVAQSKLGSDLGRAWDALDHRLSVVAGPTLNYVRTERGVGPSEASYLSWQASLNIMSHLYEETSGQQYNGWVGSLTYLGQRSGFGSLVSADRYDFTLKKLWNVGAFMPPLIVLAVRLEGSMVEADDLTLGQARDQLPVDYRIFYGGDQNLRGFARQTLSNNGLGYLTAAYFGTEMRLIEELPYHLEPFLLWDMAQLGDRKTVLDPAIFTSVGAGLRWASPIGTLRGSLAKGEIINGDPSTASYKQEWVAFLSFGQEF